MASFGVKKVGAPTPTFGAKPAGTTTFGAKPAGTTTPSFGAKPVGTATTPAFGAKPAGTATTSAFGAKPAGTATTPSFGAKPAGTATGTAATGTAAATTGTTGAAAGTAGFGRTAAGFGQNIGATGTATGGVGFGGGIGGAAGAAGAAASSEFQALVQRIQELGNRLHPESPYCALKYVFYNRVDPSQVRYYKRPDKFDPGLWIQAQTLNPDPDHLVPHQASGYPDLKARLDAQDAETGAQADGLADAETFLRLKYEEHSLKTALKLDQLKRDSLLLSHRVLTVSSHIEILRARGLAIQPDEDAWRQQLHNILMELSKPNEYRGRLNELSSRIRMQQQQQQLDIYGSGSSGGGAGMDISSDNAFSSSDLEHFTAFLQHQQAGLEHLIDILNADIKNIQTLTDHMYLIKRD